MTAIWDDPRVQRGMQRQLELRRQRIAAGERPIGWKVAFGAPQAMQNLGICAPLVGFLTDAARLPDGATFSIATATKAALEPEIAVHLGADLAAGSDREAAAAAIAALGPAIELADLDHPLDDLEGVVAGNIFQRAVILGDATPVGDRIEIERLRTRVHRDGALLAETDDPTAMVGDLIDITRHVADLLGAFDTRLEAGQVIITGSTVPLVWLEEAAHLAFDLEPLGSVSVSITTAPRHDAVDQAIASAGRDR